MKCCEPLRISSLNLLLFLLFGGIAYGDVTIYLKNSITAKEAPTLAQIARVDGDAKLASYLSTLSIDPKALQDGFVSPAEVKALLRSHYIDTSKVKIVGKGVWVYKQGSVVTKEELEQVVRNYTQSRYGNLVIESISLGVKSVKLPTSKYRVVIRERSKTFRHIYLTLALHSPTEQIRSIPVTVKVTEYIAAPFAKREIPKGKVITPEDVEIKKIKRRNSLQKPFDPSTLYGSVAKRTIHQGQQIRSSAYEPNYTIKKRSSVKILYERNGIRIELLGLALENGQKGDIIRVKNLSSNKVLRCKVLSSGSVLFVQ